MWLSLLFFKYRTSIQFFSSETLRLQIKVTYYPYHTHTSLSTWKYTLRLHIRVRVRMRLSIIDKVVISWPPFATLPLLNEKLLQCIELYNLWHFLNEIKWDCPRNKFCRVLPSVVLHASVNAIISIYSVCQSSNT